MRRVNQSEMLGETVFPLECTLMLIQHHTAEHVVSAVSFGCITNWTVGTTIVQHNQLANPCFRGRMNRTDMSLSRELVRKRAPADLTDTTLALFLSATGPVATGL